MNLLPRCGSGGGSGSVSTGNLNTNWMSVELVPAPNLEWRRRAIGHDRCSALGKVALGEHHLVNR